MEKTLKEQFAGKIKDFRLPRYAELPNMGLYLEQVTKYINGYVVPLGYVEITTSMVSNYVKKGVIASPEKKQYYKGQIAYLFFISVAKSILSMESIAQLFQMQKEIYAEEVAYDYFCNEFEKMLRHVAEKDTLPKDSGSTASDVKEMLRSVIIASSHMIFVSNCFQVKRDAEMQKAMLEKTTSEKTALESTDRKA